jgi:hypothetical protein
LLCRPPSDQADTIRLRVATSKILDGFISELSLSANGGGHYLANRNVRSWPTPACRRQRTALAKPSAGFTWFLEQVFNHAIELRIPTSPATKYSAASTNIRSWISPPTRRSRSALSLWSCPGRKTPLTGLSPQPHAQSIQSPILSFCFEALTRPGLAEGHPEQ